jgi:uncharacterized membrane protein
MTLRRSTVDWLWEAAALGALLAIFGIVATHWGELPDQIPRHFSGTGQPNGWGDKAGIWILPVLGIFFYGLLTGACFFPQSFNVPPGIDKNSPRVQAGLIQMLIVIKFMLMVLFSYIVSAQIGVALGQRPGLAPYFLGIVLPLFIALPIFYLLKLRKDS